MYPDPFATPVRLPTLAVDREQGRTSWTVRPGIIDAEAVGAFTRGHCHSLAFALHDRTGWPIAMICAPYCSLDADDCPPVDFHDAGGRLMCACQIAHFGVMTPDGRFLDITGSNPADPAALGALYGIEDDEGELRLGPADIAGRVADCPGWLAVRPDAANAVLDAVLEHHLTPDKEIPA